ncbi:small conductance calcium-activated potassium channel protein [Trichonephila clavata]|uniref:Small conductance calcium-activated potassium channel protein n=1 Tax=Trichonephila clavata TaxID=2740835 RepID=A0A8X6M2L1_TRICU|nr:small conductance calcium-activated potassium channel protein [Trichonephila clavata]
MLLSCSTLSTFKSSPVIDSGNDYEVNTRIAYAMRTVGQGFSGIKHFCTAMDLPPPVSQKAYEKILWKINLASCEVADDSMKNAAKEEILASGSNAKSASVSTCSCRAREETPKAAADRGLRHRRPCIFGRLKSPVAASCEARPQLPSRAFLPHEDCLAKVRGCIPPTTLSDPPAQGNEFAEITADSIGVNGAIRQFKQLRKPITSYSFTMSIERAFSMKGQNCMDSETPAIALAGVNIRTTFVRGHEKDAPLCGSTSPASATDWADGRPSSSSGRESPTMPSTWLCSEICFFYVVVVFRFV